MTKTIENFKGEKKEIGCIGCAIEKCEVKNDYVVFQTRYFAVEQDFEIPIPGFLILRTRRHIKSIEEFNSGEKNEFTDVLIKTRKALREVLNIDTVYFHQEEDTKHHFHLWILPRYQWMEKFGKDVKSVRPIMEYAKENLKTPENLKQIEESINKLKSHLS